MSSVGTVSAVRSWRGFAFMEHRKVCRVLVTGHISLFSYRIEVSIPFFGIQLQKCEQCVYSTASYVHVCVCVSRCIYIYLDMESDSQGRHARERR